MPDSVVTILSGGMDESFTTYPEKFLEDNPQHLTNYLKSGLQNTPGIKSDPLDIQ